MTTILFVTLAKRDEPPESKRPKGAERTSAINAPKAATETVEIVALTSEAQSIATGLEKKRVSKT